MPAHSPYLVVWEKARSAFSHTTNQIPCTASPREREITLFP
jgi:hypothetical protein